MYQTPYENQSGVLQFFYMFIINCIGFAVFGIIFSPYLCLCQGSACGKSRLIIEVGIYLISLYIRCRDTQGLRRSGAMTKINNIFIEHDGNRRACISKLSNWSKGLWFCYERGDCSALEESFRDIDLREPEEKVCINVIYE